MDQSKFYMNLSQKYLPFILSGLLLCSALFLTSLLLSGTYKQQRIGIASLFVISFQLLIEVIVVLALLLKNKFLAGLSIPSLLFYGITGVIQFLINGFYPLYLTHVLMLSISVYLLYFVWKVMKGRKEIFWFGLLLGICILFFFLFMSIGLAIL